MGTASLKILPKIDTNEIIKIKKKNKNIITSTANSEDSRTVRAAIHPDINHESEPDKKVSLEKKSNPRNLINEALDDFTSKQSEDTMVAMVKRHESTKLLDAVIKMPIYDP